MSLRVRLYAAFGPAARVLPSQHRIAHPVLLRTTSYGAGGMWPVEQRHFTSPGWKRDVRRAEEVPPGNQVG